MPSKPLSSQSPRLRQKRIWRRIDHRLPEGKKVWTPAEREEAKYKINARAAIPKAIELFEGQFGELSRPRRLELLKNLRRKQMLDGEQMHGRLSFEKQRQLHTIEHNLDVLLGDQRNAFWDIFLQLVDELDFADR